MMDEALGPKPVTVVGARVEMRGRIRVDARDDVVVEAGRGQPVRVFIRYEFEETTVHREDFEIRVEGSVGDQDAAPRVRRHNDKLLVHDVAYGVVGPEFCFDEPGAYHGRIRAEVDFVERNWLGGGTPQGMRRVVEFPVTVHVH